MVRDLVVGTRGVDVRVWVRVRVRVPVLVGETVTLWLEETSLEVVVGAVTL